MCSSLWLLVVLLQIYHTGRLNPSAWEWLLFFLSSTERNAYFCVIHLSNSNDFTGSIGADNIAGNGSDPYNRRRSGSFSDQNVQK